MAALALMTTLFLASARLGTADSLRSRGAGSIFGDDPGSSDGGDFMDAYIKSSKGSSEGSVWYSKPDAAPAASREFSRTASRADTEQSTPPAARGDAEAPWARDREAFHMPRFSNPTIADVPHAPPAEVSNSVPQHSAVVDVKLDSELQKSKRSEEVKVLEAFPCLLAAADPAGWFGGKKPQSPPLATQHSAVVDVKLDSELQKSKRSVFFQASARALGGHQAAPDVTATVESQRLQDVYIHDGFDQASKDDAKNLQELKDSKDLKA